MVLDQPSAIIRLRIQGCVKSFNFDFNLFSKQKDRSATYIDMHEVHVDTL